MSGNSRATTQGTDGEPGAAVCSNGEQIEKAVNDTCPGWHVFFFFVRLQHNIEMDAATNKASELVYFTSCLRYERLEDFLRCKGQKAK